MLLSILSSRFETVESSMVPKKRKPLSIKEKRIDVTNELGLPKSTVNTKVSKQKEIETNAFVFGSASKQAHGACHGELEVALLKRFKGG
ncbi:hypothetical protein HPB51_022826 [Rhipicephalus microplus]|uniref:Uncharacterized protein n=1 Tax=Rhipicephalus microplus TaxID=6941 RepID=A0A9J6DDD3_RHIMP|nr:hypothetical protein HPB51_022826 [Rhipicephalus microplus]